MIIFLDIDGVLNSEKCHFGTTEEYSLAKKKFKNEFGIHFLLPNRNVLPFIRCINWYIKRNKTNPIKAVLSSTWRYSEENIGLLNNMLYKKGLLDKNFIIDRTDRLHDCSSDKDRGNQIKRWVKKNKPNGFIILDDEVSTMIHRGRLYNTKSENGFDELDCVDFIGHLMTWASHNTK
ncbi:MAG: HAD domain-containing protein [Fusobacteriaceae bacterium]